MGYLIIGCKFADDKYQGKVMVGKLALGLLIQVRLESSSALQSHKRL